MKKQAKVGILAIVAILLLIFGYSFLKGNNLLKSDRTFYALYDNVEGLAPGAAVTISGLNVGKVTSIDFHDEQGRLKVEFMITKKFDFTKSSLARIYGGGLIGGKSLAIIPEYGPDIAVSGDYLQGEIEPGISDIVNSRLTPLQEKMETLIVTADSVMTGINDVLRPENRENLSKAIASLDGTIRDMDRLLVNANGLVTSNSEKIATTLTDVQTASANFAALSNDIKDVEIAKVVAELETSVAGFNDLMAKVNNGEGSIGKLMSDSRMYDNLEGASKQLEQLLQDMKLNPKRYVHFSLFGKRNKEYDPPVDAEQ